MNLRDQPLRHASVYTHSVNEGILFNMVATIQDGWSYSEVYTSAWVISSGALPHPCKHLLSHYCLIWTPGNVNNEVSPYYNKCEKKALLSLKYNHNVSKRILSPFHFIYLISISHSFSWICIILWYIPCQLILLSQIFISIIITYVSTNIKCIVGAKEK